MFVLGKPGSRRYYRQFIVATSVVALFTTAGLVSAYMLFFH